jgi:hypothetical protein
LDDKVAYLKGNIVALGPDAHQKVVMEAVMEVRRYFILYEVQEVGSIPTSRVQTIQLVAPLNSHPSISPSLFPSAHSHGILPMLLSILSCLQEAW